MEAVLKALQTALDLAIQLWPITIILLGMVGVLIATREKKKK